MSPEHCSSSRGGVVNYAAEGVKTMLSEIIWSKATETSSCQSLNTRAEAFHRGFPLPY